MIPGTMQQTLGWFRIVLTLLVLIVLKGGGDVGVQAARILGIFPTPSISHQLPYQAVMKALVARGHHVTVISPDPLKVPVPNYTDIDLSFSYKAFREKFIFADHAEVSGIGLQAILTSTMPEIIDDQLSSPAIKEFLRSNQKFDMVFLEWFWFQAYFGVLHHVGSPPLVGIISLGGLTNSYQAINNPINPAFNPELVLGYSDKMSFFERIHNTFVNIWMAYHWNWNVFPTQDALMRKHFGDAPPPVAETERNMSLLVLHNHWTTDYARAHLPNVVQITGNHIKEKLEPLPKDLQKWLDEAEGQGGVLYFSLGTNVMSKDLPEAKLKAILRALSRLPLRVLWKFELDDLPGRPANVRISKWVPQQTVLAHPSIRLFVMQGGLQSFQEAVYHSVPLLGIPFMGDQHYNVAKMVSAGVGRRLELRDLTEETFYENIMTILQDKRYKKNIEEMSVVFREHKTASMDRAIWWIEYVLRHNGAPHLRSAGRHLTWYQYLLLDVAAAALSMLAFVFFTLRMILRKVCHAVWGRGEKPFDGKRKFKKQ